MPDLNTAGKIIINFILVNKFYFLLGAGLLILLAGAVFLTLKARKRRAVPSSPLNFANRPAKEEEDKFGLKEIPNQVSRLINLGEEIRDLLIQIEKRQEQILDQQGRQLLFTTLDDRIYQAYKKGLGVAELAAEYGRSKGEVELIINLYKKRLKGGNGL